MNPKLSARSTTPVDHHIGARIRARRLDLGMSQETLAALVGVTFQQIQKYERGVNRVASSKLLEIARAMECHITNFLPESQKNAVGCTIDALAFQELCKAFASLSVEGQQILLDTARSFAAQQRLRRIKKGERQQG